MIKELADIYRIEKYKDEIVNMEGFGNKSFNKSYSSVKKSRKTNVIRLLYSLGIPNIGLSNAKLICRKFNYDWNAISNADYSQLIEISGVGEVMAKSYIDYFNNNKIRKNRRFNERTGA
jgi:DNA ligase (NAD+)